MKPRMWEAGASRAVEKNELAEEKRRSSVEKRKEGKAHGDQCGEMRNL